MITIDLDDNDDCVFVENKSEKLEDAESDYNFKKKLIFQVRRHRSLYDNKHKLFSNVAKKELVWQQIADKLSSNVHKCKDTWFELRYGYQRYARKLRNYFIHGHKENRKRPSMSLESELMFLWRFIDNRKTCKIPFEIPEIKNAETKLSKDFKIQKQIDDDDIILLEDPVELIVIDEDDDGDKSDDQFKLTITMKTLVSHIKTYPEIYNSQHVAFKDYARKSFIWNAIANSMGDKATKLMKIWIVMQTRYEWEICQANQNSDNKAAPPSELQNQLAFFKGFIIKNPDTVYKQSYFLKSAWYDPIDYFKDIYNLIVRMKKMANIVYITDSLLNSREKSKHYLSLWTDIANLKNSSAGQCETTWLIMRYFYWELMNMRQQNYQLTDKWYFETIITELYAISKAAQTTKQQEYEHLKQNKSQNKPNRKASKRPVQTNATSQGSPANKKSSPITTATTMTPTIINNLQTVSSTNTTPSTQSTTVSQLILPKITAAISLAPQALKTGTLQIKQIPAPPALSPAPPSPIVPSGAPTTAASPATTVSTHMSMSFNLPIQTKVTPIPMPTLIRPTVSSTTSPTVRNPTHATLSVQPGSLLRSPLANIQPAPWSASATSSAMPTLMPITTPNINSVVTPKSTFNTQTSSPLASCNSSTTFATTSVQSIASFKITAASTNTAATTSTNTHSCTTSITTVAPTTSPTTALSSSQLPKITGAISLLNANEILIELIASQHGNQLVVHGPSLSSKYQLSMLTVAKFIREVLAIPLLHNKRTNQPGLINCYWEHISTKFNLPVHICRACWNFLQENFNHFPQIAPLKELMKPFQTSLNVWKVTLALFTKFDRECASKNWLQHTKNFPDVVECIGSYPVLYKDVGKENLGKNHSEMETLCAWRTISLRFPKIPEIQEIWTALKRCFVQYMNDLEYGIDNKWTINWWRSLARLKFLVETRYSQNEPFYYIVTNKMLEEIDKCALMEMRKRYKSEYLPESTNEKINTEPQHDEKNIPLSLPSTNEIESLMASHSKSIKDVELGYLITTIQKYPVICGKGDNIAKYEAWKKVAEELHMEVPHCLFALKRATEKYFAYKKMDPVNRFHINERYYKKLDEIIRNSSSGKFSTRRGKINIKTPFELNQSVDMDSSTSGSDLVFPERYISDINMSNSPSNLVVKNWVYAIGNIPNFVDSSNFFKLKHTLKKYLPNFK